MGAVAVFGIDLRLLFVALHASHHNFWLNESLAYSSGAKFICACFCTVRALA